MNCRIAGYTCSLFFALMFSSLHGEATPNQFTFHPIYLEEKLTKDFSYASIKDKEGFLWIATDYGLRRYDGYGLRNFIKSDDDPSALGSSGIFKLLLHSNGSLWIGGSILSLYDSETEAFSNFEITDYKSIHALAEDGNGMLWLGGGSFGLLCFDPLQKEVLNTYFKDTPEGHISDIRPHFNKSAIWVASKGGIYLFDLNTKQIINRPLSEHISLHTDISSLAQDSTGKLWVATNRGLFSLNEAQNKVKHYTAKPGVIGELQTDTLTTLKIDSKNRLWIGSDKKGLYLYKPDSDNFSHSPPATFTEGMLPPGNIFDIFEDEQGTLWFSVGPYGIFRLSKNHDKFKVYKNSPEFDNSLSFNNVLEMLEDDNGDIWVATDGGGLNVLDIQNDEFRHFSHSPGNSSSISSNSVISLSKDQDGNIWAGTWGGGLNRFTPRTGKFTRFLPDSRAAKGKSIAGNNVFDIEVLKGGQLLLAVWGTGLQLYDPEKNSFRTLQDNSGQSMNTVFNEIQASNDGNYWLSSYSGLDKYYPDTQKIERIDLPIHEGAFDIYEDEDDTLWVSTPSGLLKYLPHIGEVKIYSRQDGLSDNFVVGIEEDSLGYLWISTRNGLNKFDTENETFEVFGLNDGLAGSQFTRSSHLKTSNNKLLFGSTEGLIFFDPERLPRNEYAPKVHLLGLKLFQKSITPGKSPWLSKPLNKLERLTLPYNQRDISFDFTALNFISPEKNKFRFRLTTLESDWLETNSRGRSVRYTNLAPGDYTFQILSANNDGVWNGRARELPITILPAWWQTWWAYISYLFFAIAAIYTYGQWKVRQNRQNEIQLKLLVDEQTAQLRRANRTVIQINNELEQRVVQRTQALSQEIEERRESEARVTFIAYHDSLTGLYNRAWILNHLDELIIAYSSTKYAVFYIGGDRFRKINDTHGHLIGDALLKEASERLKDLVPQDYHLVRLGSDEFAIVIDQYKPELDADKQGNTICEAFTSKFIIEKIHIAFGVSVGILIGNGEYTEASQILRDANLAMQNAKEKGRGTYRVFDEKMLEATLESANLENALKNALANNEFSVVYQPIITMGSQHLDSFELLLRWNHPDLGMVPPIKFIGLAESLGLIFDIGIWVIKQACLQLTEWKKSFGEENLPNISVNLSPLQLGQDDLLPLINTVLTETGAPVDKIKLEITESALMLDTDPSNQLLEDLRKRGFELAIDDFGTGYSSLSYLDRLPVQILKIDRAFVNALFDSENEAGHAHEIVRATINLAHSLQMRVVAEGIETPQQLETLKDYDCDFGQGFFIAKPMPAEKATEFLKSS